MGRKNLRFAIVIATIFLVVSAGIWLESAPPASAQCGSQASSCKNCHEVQGEMPVNTDGTAWHQSHAFGDFCAVCHAGNSQATDKAAAHSGLEAPLANVTASCQQCHVNDLEERAQVYAVALGIEIGSSGGSASTNGSPAPSGSDAANSSTGGTTAAIVAPAASELVIDDPDVVDYVQRYNEIVMGNTPINIGNAILVGLILLLAIGGGGYVLYNENWVQITTKPIAALPEGYPADLVELLPKLQKLSDKGRQGLEKLIEDPDAADELLDVLARHTKKGA